MGISEQLYHDVYPFDLKKTKEVSNLSQQLCTHSFTIKLLGSHSNVPCFCFIYLCAIQIYIAGKGQSFTSLFFSPRVSGGAPYKERSDQREEGGVRHCCTNEKCRDFIFLSNAQCTGHCPCVLFFSRHFRRGQLYKERFS